MPAWEHNYLPILFFISINASACKPLLLVTCNNIYKSFSRSNRVSYNCSKWWNCNCGTPRSYKSTRWTMYTYRDYTALCINDLALQCQWMLVYYSERWASLFSNFVRVLFNRAYGLLLLTRRTHSSTLPAYKKDHVHLDFRLVKGMLVNAIQRKSHSLLGPCYIYHWMVVEIRL